MPANEFIPTRRSLLSRLKNWNDQASWQDFFDTYWKLIYSVARQSGLHDAEAQDVLQEVLLAVAKKMPAFKYDPAIGSFKSWLLLITRRRITDNMRKQAREPALQGPASDGAGQVFQLGGDSVFAVFDHASSALNRALEIQRAQDSRRNLHCARKIILKTKN